MIGGSNSNVNNKKRSIEMSQATDENPILSVEKIKDLQEGTKNLQEQVKKQEEIIKIYRARFQDELTTILSLDQSSRSLYQFLENPVNAIILSDLDFNFKIKKGKYEGATFAYALLTDAHYVPKLIDFILDKIKHIDFNVRSRLGSPFFALVKTINFSVERNIGYDSEKENIFRNLLTTILGEISLEELNVNNTDNENKDKNVMHILAAMLSYNFPSAKLSREKDDFFDKILNSMPLSIDLKFSYGSSYGPNIQERLKKTEWNSRVEFIVKLQDTQKAWDKMKASALENLDTQEASKNLTTLLDEAKVLAVAAEKDGYWSAHYWLSILHEDILKSNEPDIDNLNQFRSMVKKISKNHPKYEYMQSKLAHEYMIFQTPQEMILKNVPVKERTEAQKAEIETLQEPRLMTALRAADNGRFQDSCRVKQNRFALRTS